MVEGEAHVREEKREREMGMNDLQYRNRRQICKLISVLGKWENYKMKGRL